MLRRANRHEFKTLLDAITLARPGAPGSVYLETARPPVEVSCTDFRGAVWRYAAALQRMNIEPRDLVIIAHTQNLESVFAFWGAMLMGAIPSMFPTLTEKLDADIYLRNLSELASRSHVRAVLTTDEFAATLRPRLLLGVRLDQLKAGVGAPRSVLSPRRRY
jgi:acyl-CoA synthetase (AMP-forming)/AMP-acid ligase II